MQYTIQYSIESSKPITLKAFIEMMLVIILYYLGNHKLNKDNNINNPNEFI